MLYLTRANSMAINPFCTAVNSCALSVLATASFATYRTAIAFYVQTNQI